MHSSGNSREQMKARPRRRYLWLTGVVVVVVAAVGGLLVWRAEGEVKPRASASPPAVPVTVAVAERRDVAMFFDGLGTVQASNTVAIRSQVDGKIISINFTEGQEVHKGDTLAAIDPRSFQATLDQAVAKKAQDQAQLISAQKDLKRFQDLEGKGFETQQNLDQQQAKVDQFKAAIDTDQGAIESAQTQLSYATITAPIDGRVGFRQVDLGNIIHANDPNPLTVLTQIRPSVATFTLPQKNLAKVREAMLRGPVVVLALDQDNMRQLAQGELLLIDNQIDQATSTIRLKARFANEDDRLWPGEFVHVRIQVDTSKDSVTIPPAAVQRGPQGLYTWIVTANNTVEQRPIETTSVDADTAIVTKGVAQGEHVVTNGQYRLQAGTLVDAHTEAAATASNEAP